MKSAVLEHTAQTQAPARVRAILDVELTNRCNARCIMCPREKTPAMGLMTEEIFRKVVARALDYGRVEGFVMCGLGEPLLHPEVVEFVGMAARAGVRPSIVTNGSLLTKEMSRALVEAGVNNVNVSLGGFTKKTYEAVHRGLKFHKVYRNALDFVEVARGRASMNIQISPTEETIGEADKIAAFWRANGAKFCFFFPFTASRGGAISRDEGEARHCQVDRYEREPPGCISIEELFRPSRRDAGIMHTRAPFVCYPKDRATFISWQGDYHLCSSDYKKEYAIGSVLDLSIDDAYARKARVSPSNNALCANCDFSNGDLRPRGVGFFLRAGAYLLGSRWAAARGTEPHPDLASYAHSR